MEDDLMIELVALRPKCEKLSISPPKMRLISRITKLSKHSLTKRP